MIDAVLGLFGPLAKPECLRASKRGWLIWLRLIPAIGAGLVVFLVVWAWSTFLDFDPTHLPYTEIRTGLIAIAGSLVALALLIAPAVLAGSLAGEKERGSIGLLLSTQASSGDIVMGRWVGRLAPVALVAASAFPALLGLAFLAGMGGSVTLMLFALPLAVGLGGGGFALGVSAVSKRGRDALLLIYLIDAVLLVGPVFDSRATPMLGAGVAGGSAWSDLWDSVGWGMFNPFLALIPLVWGERISLAVVTSLVWAIMGALGLAVAAWRLRPSCLNDGSKPKRKAHRRWWNRVPPVGTRPMLWKELHVERAGSLGRVGRWVGGVLIAWLAIGSLILAALVVRDTYRADAFVVVGGVSRVVEPGAVGRLADWYGGSAVVIGFLIQWAVGLRAGVTIASERERGTWDALLTSPLEGGEIIRGKLWGSLHALRWLIGAALIAWTITWLCNGMSNREYATNLAETACLSGLMAAGGVAISLRTATATKAMGVTLALWLGAYLGLRVISFFLCLIIAGTCFLGWLTAIQMGLVSVQSTPWFPMPFRSGMEWMFCALTLSFTALLVLDTRIRFDRTAGRMTGGTTTIKFDELIHGRPMAPVRLETGPRRAVASVDSGTEA